MLEVASQMLFSSLWRIMKTGVKPQNQPEGLSRLSFQQSHPPGMVLPAQFITAPPASTAFGASSSTKRPHEDLRHLLKELPLKQRGFPCFGRQLAVPSPAPRICQERVRAEDLHTATSSPE